MRDIIATIRVLGTDVACYLQPGTDCDRNALAREVEECCAACGSMEDVQAEMRAVADRHGLALEYHTASPLAKDPVERMVSFGFVPRTN